jgi:hypothetical protein
MRLQPRPAPISVALHAGRRRCAGVFAGLCQSPACLPALPAQERRSFDELDCLVPLTSAGVWL